MPSTGAIPEAPAAGQASERRIYTTALLLFLCSAAFTVWMCLSMDGGMDMPGGWQMSMAWMPMQGQGWLGASAMFLAMWLAMMIAMMLPSALPMLLLFRRLRRFRDDARAHGVWLVVSGYFAVWLAFGALAWGLGVTLTQVAMTSDAISRAIPWLSIASLAIAGLWQFTPWKSACLDHCRNPFAHLARHPGDTPMDAVRLGLSHGAWCVGCCWGLMLVQLSLGVMSLLLMSALAVWIALEKLSPLGPRLAPAGGYVALLAALTLSAVRLSG